MAVLTGGGECGRCVVWRLSPVKFIHVAGSAVLSEAGELVVDMALPAGGGSVLSRQREFRRRGVVKLRAHPLR